MKTFYTEDDVATVREIAMELGTRIADVRRQAAEVERTFGLTPMQTAADVDTADRVATVMSRSPGASIEVLSSADWDIAPSAALQLVERGRSIAALRARVQQHFTPAVLEQDHAADIAYVERKAEGLFAFLAALDGRWRAIRSRWTGYRVGTYQPSLVEQSAEMKQVDRLICRAKSADGFGGRRTITVRNALARGGNLLGRARRVRAVGGRAPLLRDAVQAGHRRHRGRRATVA